jgi:hypothetical protein
MQLQERPVIGFQAVTNRKTGQKRCFRCYFRPKISLARADGLHGRGLIKSRMSNRSPTYFGETTSRAFWFTKIIADKPLDLLDAKSVERLRERILRR